jgi:protein-tyrosine-phosphatase
MIPNALKLQSEEARARSVNGKLSRLARTRLTGFIPEVVQVMTEVGIDFSNAKPPRLTEELAKDADLLITMGCGDECPFVPGLKRDDWPLPDPKGKDI